MSKEQPPTKEELQKQLDEIKEKAQKLTTSIEKDSEELSSSKNGNKGNNPDTNTSKNTEGIPAFNATKTKQALEDLGYSKAEIDNIRPEDALKIAKEGKLKPQDKTEEEKKNNPKNELKPEKKEEKLDLQKVSEKISEEIKKQEAEKITKREAPLTLEEKQKLAQEILLSAKEKFQKEQIESSGMLKRAFVKTGKWWENLGEPGKNNKGENKSEAKIKWGKVLKVAMSTAFIGSTTLLAGSGLGIAPPPLGIASKLLTRVGMAVGLNMALTSNLSGKFFGIFKEKKEDKSIYGRTIGKLGTATLLGVGASFILSGGTVGLIAAGGVIARKSLNAYFDYKMKQAEEVKRNLSKINDNFDINALEKNLELIGKGYDDVEKSLKNYKRWKNIGNGALTIGAGLATMEAFHHKTFNPETDSETQAKNTTDIKHQQELKQQEELKHKIEGHYKTQDAHSGNLHNQPPTEDQFFKTEGFKGEQVQFSSRGAIQTIEDLKEKLHSDYPDITKAPQSVQEFLKTNSTQEAIKLGFFDPNNTSGAESAMLIKGSTLEFDSKGNLSLHDIKTGETHTLIQGNNETVEKYHGKMFDSDHSKDTEINTLKEKNITGGEGLNKIKPLEVDENGNIVESTNTLREEDMPYEQEKNVSDLNNKNEPIIDHSQEKSFVEENHNTHNVNSHDIKENTKLDENQLLEKKGSLVENTNNLKVYNFEDLTESGKEIYKDNLHKMFPTEASMKVWEEIKNSSSLSAEKLMSMNINDVKPEYRALILELKKLQEVTKLDPIVGGPLSPSETINEYIIRTMVKTGDDLGRLDDVKFNADQLVNREVKL